jgi:hypothetical protein
VDVFNISYARDPFALQLRAGSSLRLKNGSAQDDAIKVRKNTDVLEVGLCLR